MDNIKLSQKITEAQLKGLRQIQYEEEGTTVTLIVPEQTPRTMEMMYGW